MIHLKRRSLCKICLVCFIRDGETQIYCHSCLSNSLYKSPRLPEGGHKKSNKCLICAKWFFPLFGRSTCSSGCKKQLIDINQKNHRDLIAKEEEGIIPKAQRWIKKESNSGQISISYDELNRRSECARAFSHSSDSFINFSRKGI